mgnify:CR=1 FL=1
MTAAVLLPSALLSGCSGNGEGDIQFTNPVYDAGDADTNKNPYPGMELEYYSDSQTEEDSRQRAVVVTSLDEIRDDMIGSGLDIQSVEYTDVQLSDFDNGFVADITMKVELADGKTSDRHILGYFKTVRLPDGTYRTYFVYYHDVKPGEKVDDKSKEEILDEIMDNLKPSKDNSSSQGVPSSSQNSKDESGSQASSSQAPEDSGNIDDISSKPEPISEVVVDEVF